jgi:hypothetical protein
VSVLDSNLHRLDRNAAKKGPYWLEMVIQQGLVSLLSWGASGEGYGEEAEKALIAGVLPRLRVV